MARLTKAENVWNANGGRDTHDKTIVRSGMQSHPDFFALAAYQVAEKLLCKVGQAFLPVNFKSKMSVLVRQECLTHR